MSRITLAGDRYGLELEDIEARLGLEFDRATAGSAAGGKGALNPRSIEVCVIGGREISICGSGFSPNDGAERDRIRQGRFCNCSGILRLHDRRTGYRENHQTYRSELE
jgi:hypothetical protein